MSVRTIRLAVLGVSLLIVPAGVIIAQENDKRVVTTTRNDADNDRGFDMGWLGLLGLAGLAGLTGKRRHDDIRHNDNRTGSSTTIR